MITAFFAITAQVHREVDLVIKTSDGVLSDTKTVKVKINNSNDEPVCPDSMQVIIRENHEGPLRPMLNGISFIKRLPTNGSAVGGFTFSDQDSDTLT